MIFRYVELNALKATEDADSRQMIPSFVVDLSPPDNSNSHPTVVTLHTHTNEVQVFTSLPSSDSSPQERHVYRNKSASSQFHFKHHRTRNHLRNPHQSHAAAAVFERRLPLHDLPGRRDFFLARNRHCFLFRTRQTRCFYCGFASNDRS